MSDSKSSLQLSSQNLVNRYSSVFSYLKVLKNYKQWQLLDWHTDNAQHLVLVVECDLPVNERESVLKSFSLFEQVLLQANLPNELPVPILFPVNRICEWQLPQLHTNKTSKLQQLARFYQTHFGEPSFKTLSSKTAEKQTAAIEASSTSHSRTSGEIINGEIVNRKMTKSSWVEFSRQLEDNHNWYLQDEISLEAIHPVYILLLSAMLTLDKYQQSQSLHSPAILLNPAVISRKELAPAKQHHEQDKTAGLHLNQAVLNGFLQFNRDLPLTVFQWLDLIRAEIYKQRVIPPKSGQNSLINGSQISFFRFYEDSGLALKEGFSSDFAENHRFYPDINHCGVNLAVAFVESSAKKAFATMQDESRIPASSDILQLTATQKPRFNFVWQLDMNRFSADFPANVHASFLMVTRAICRYPKQLVAALFSRNDLNDALFLPKNLLPTPKTITHLPIAKFEAVAKNKPLSIAIIDVQENGNEAKVNEINYGELNQKANQLSRLLMSRITQQQPKTLSKTGKKHADFTQANVVVLLPVSVHSVVSALAIAKINGIYIPLDPSYPVERLQAMLNRLSIDAVIHTDSLTFLARRLIQSHSSSLHNKLISLDSEKAQTELRDFSSQNLPVTPINRIKPQQNSGFSTAYLMFTSGTTGEPKGVSGALLSIANRVDWFEQVLTSPQQNNTGTTHVKNTETHTFAACSSPSFVDHIADYWQPLASGNTVGLCAQPSDNQAFLQRLAWLKVSCLSVLPSKLVQLVSQPEFCQLRSLKLIVTSGEPLTTGLAEHVHMAFEGRVRLINIYGTTESGADVAWHEVPYLAHYSVMRYFQQQQPIAQYESTELSGIAGEAFTQPNIPLDALFNDFSDASVPQTPQEYKAFTQSLQHCILPYLVNVSSSKFIGHMTSALPDFMATLNRLITSANQNLVKIETSKVLTLLERQVLAKMHKLFYQYSEDFYAQHIQDPDHMFGTITSGGSLANVTALYCARNKGLLQQGITTTQLKQRGAIQCTLDCGFNQSVILVSRLAHYSIRKTAGLLGLGENNLLIIEQDDNQRINLTRLEHTIESCRQNRVFIIAIIGIAGATETGTVDPLPELAAVAREQNIHFHVDAAWGGAFMLSEDYAYKLNGIEHADSITFCAHKQLYLAQGISMCLVRDSQALQAISTHAEYQAAAGSFDLGQYSLEGSRPAVSLMLHGALSLFGQSGYSWLIGQSMQKAAFIRELILACPAMELVGENDLNIINYRYIPAQFRDLPTPYNKDIQQQISQATDAIQAQQFLDGKTFVSRTQIRYAPVSEEKISVFRVVPINPLTRYSDIVDVINEQLDIANRIIESSPVNKAMHVPQKPDNTSLVPIGKPVQNVGVFILDPFMNPPPCGVAGDIYVTGMALAEGYYNDDELTDERFISNPYSQSELDKRLYKTGDTGRINHLGDIEFCGRADRQIKINGNRVELSAITHAIMLVDWVESVQIVMVSGLTERRDKLVAVVQTGKAVFLQHTNTEQRQLTQALVGALQKMPQDHQVDQWVIVRQIPLLPNGKTNILQCEQMAREALIASIN